MAKVEWILDGRKASELTIARTLADARAARLHRGDQIRERLREELGSEIDSRELATRTRRKLREEEAERRQLERELRKLGTAIRRAARDLNKPVYALAKPFPGRENSARENARFDTLFPLKRGSIRKSDGLYSFHCKFTSRGFGERRKDRSRVYRKGEAVKHLRYIIRELARELSQGGVVSNISQDPGELAAFFDALEQLEEQDRENANVYMSLVVSLPHELTSEGREEALTEICAMLAEHELPHVGVLHAPDPGGDPRNFHAHIMFSLRPCEIIQPGQFAFSRDKCSDLNDASFIKPFRHRVSDILNAAMEREGHSRRFTALSDADRGLAPRTKESGKSTPGQKHWERKKNDLNLMLRERDILARRDAALAGLAEVASRISVISTDRSPIVAAARRRTREALLRVQAGIAAAAANRSRLLRSLTEQTIAYGAARLQRLGTKLDRSQVDRSAKIAEQIEINPVRSDEPANRPVARAQPAKNAREPRGTERRKAIANAAWQLKRRTWPALVRTRAGFSLSSDHARFLRDVDRFEAEPVIQAVHRAKWGRMLSAVQKKIDSARRSPFVSGEGRPRLQLDFLPDALRTALFHARGNQDVEEMLMAARLRWQEREAREKEAKRRKARREERRKEALKELLQPRVAEVFKRLQDDIAAHRILHADIEPIQTDIRIVAKAVVRGEVHVALTDGQEWIHFESEGLRSIAEQLSASKLGAAIFRDLCDQTRGAPLDLADLPVTWATPALAPLPSVDSIDEEIPIPGWKEVERDVW